jgi:beta-lactamase regulating signal transducer with metallopeptidase domain
MSAAMSHAIGAEWIVYLLVTGTLVVLSAGLIASALSAAGRPTRWAWTAALAAIVILGIAAPRARTLAMAATRSYGSAPVGASSVTSQPKIGALVARAGDAIEVVVARAIALVSGSLPESVARAILFGWMISSAVLLALYLLVNLRVWRARRHWPRQRLHGMEVRVAPTAGPAVIGVVRAEIVVPRSLLERSADAQRLILAHEDEHLSAHDNLLLGAACAVAIVLPWHPAVWFVLARLRLAIEMDCDARVLRRGAPAHSYGALLIDMAAHAAGIRVGTLALADRPSHLERRLLAMRTHRSRFTLVRTGTLSVVAGLLVLAACEAKVPTAADIASMDVASAQKNAAEAGFLRTPSGDRTDFFVNGMRVTADQARGMEAKNIGSIEVVKSELAGGRDTIYVTTADRMPKRLEGDLPVRESKERGESEQTFMKMKQTKDSAEHMVAHVERELAAVRANEDSLAASHAKQRSVAPMRTRDGAEPVFIVDGKRVSSAAFASLRQEDVAAVSVYKGDNALRISSEPDAKNGVIVVNTKSAKNR